MVPTFGQGAELYWATKYDINDDNRDRFLISGSIKYQFAPWLSLELRSGADLYTTNAEAKMYSLRLYARQALQCA